MSDPQSPERIDPEETEMSVSPPQHRHAEPFDDYDDGVGNEMPARTRPRYLTPLTALLLALILGGVGFYAGIRIEKSKTTTSGGGSALARAFSGAPAGAGGASAGLPSLSASGSVASRSAGAGGLAGGLGNATIGSVSSVDGNTLYIQETGGNTVKVKLSGATTLTKSESVSKKKLNPGDSVVIQGAKTSNGTVDASSVTDSGASSTSSNTGSSSGSNSTSGTSAASAVSSLFGGG